MTVVPVLCNNVDHGVHLAGVTANPNGQWVSQQARQYIWTIEEREETFGCLIHDNDRKFTETFDDVFQSKQIHVIHTPIEAPNANSYAERWIRSVREECLDHALILNEAHLRRVLQTYIDITMPVGRIRAWSSNHLTLSRAYENWNY